MSTFRPSALLGRLEHQPDDGIGAAERLEAAEPEPKTLVLEVDRADAELLGERRQGAQRRRPVVRPMRQEALDRFGGVDAEGLGIDRLERLAVVGVLVADEHCVGPPVAAH